MCSCFRAFRSTEMLCLAFRTERVERCILSGVGTIHGGQVERRGPWLLLAGVTVTTPEGGAALPWPILQMEKET